nr:iron ABC transporter permease [Amycolatopsis umgeniensis]
MALFAVALFVGGSANIPAGQVIPAALGRTRGLSAYVVFETRLPRAVTAVACGAAFGLAGALYQRLFRNPLATPDVIGVTEGSGLGAVIVITLLSGGGLGVQFGALIGGVVTAAVIFWFGWGHGVRLYRLILIGIGLTAVCSAATNLLLTRASQANADRAYHWLVGSLNGSSWDGVAVLAAAVALGAVGTWLARVPLATLGTGDELATGLGVRITWVRAGVLLLGAAVAALATSVTGPLGFVALVAGPIATRLTGPGRELAASALVGAALVSCADLIAQNAPLIGSSPTGAVTALIGAPYLIRLLLKRKASA